jgi:short-subunit dehydrogenase involved in D-alanine esterification of teichoic acids
MPRLGAKGALVTGGTNGIGLAAAIAERIQLLGGISVAMAHDVAEMTLIRRPPQRAAGVVPE